MVERIDWPKGELDVAIGIDVVRDPEHNIGNVLNIDIFVDNDDALGKHRLSQRPDAVHHLAGVTGIRLADRDNHQIVKDTLDGQIHVDDLGERQLHQRKEDALDGLAHPGVFHRGLPYDSGGIDRIFTVGDAGDVKDGILIGKAVKAGVVAEGSFRAQLVEVHIAFEDDLSIGGHFEVHSFAFHELDRLLAQETGDDELFDLRWSRNDRRKSEGWLGTNR